MLLTNFMLMTCNLQLCFSRMFTEASPGNPKGMKIWKHEPWGSLGLISWKIIAFFDVFMVFSCFQISNLKSIIFWGPAGRNMRSFWKLRRNLYFRSPGGRGTFFSRLGAGALARPATLPGGNQGTLAFPRRPTLL